MNRPIILAAAVLFPLLAQAQETGQMDHSQMNHDAMMQTAAASGLTEGGQGAFAAIAEIVAVLDADPATDWARVDIEGLRQHLIDMDNVTLRAQVAMLPTDTGATFSVISTDPAVTASIRRMVTAHAATMDGNNGWAMTAAEVEGGAELSVSGTAADLPKIAGLGFIGVMTLGMHHQAHHLAVASGQNPHN
jgi:hypothetical protein